MGTFLFIIGIALLLIGGVMFMIEAFSESIFWGLGCLLVAPVSIVFAYLFWDTCKKPVTYQLVGASFLLLSSLLK
mgnify:FL=1